MFTLPDTVCLTVPEEVDGIRFHLSEEETQRPLIHIERECLAECIASANIGNVMLRNKEPQHDREKELKGMYECRIPICGLHTVL